MRLVLHVGAHKTGTTLIQSSLREHAGELRGHGVEYFDARHPDLRRAGFAGVGRCLARHGVTDDMPRRYRQTMAVLTGGPWETALLSSEALLAPNVFRGEAGQTTGSGIYPFAKQQFAFMRDATDLPMTVVLYLRQQAGLLESLYAQFSTFGLVAPFAEWVAEIDLDQLSWRPVVEAAVATVGADHLVLKGFRLPVVGPADHLQEFLEDALGLAGIATDEWLGRNMNPRLSSLGLMVRRRLDDVPLSRSQEVALAGLLRRHFSITDGPPARPMPDDMRAHLDERYTAENARLLSEYGMPRDRERPPL